MAHEAFKTWVTDSKLADNVADYEQAWPFKLSDNFLLGEQGLILQYGEYEIGPYVVGLPRLVIPYDQLQEVLKKSICRSLKRNQPQHLLQKWKLMRLFDTHTHFDVADFDEDRQQLALNAKKAGVDALVLIGFVQSRFDELLQTHHQLNSWENVPTSYLAPGLHPFYIEQHQPEHLSYLEQILQKEECVAVGEIGLDTFLKSISSQISMRSKNNILPIS